jgi:hypothetical protein
MRFTLAAMRTTISLAPENKKTLQSIASERGERSVSRIVEEAISFYLAERNKPAPAPLVPEIVTVTVPAPAPVQGPWQRLGAHIDRSTDGNPSLVALLRVIVRSSLGRLRILRAN